MPDRYRFQKKEEPHGSNSSTSKVRTRARRTLRREASADAPRVAQPLLLPPLIRLRKSISALLAGTGYTTSSHHDPPLLLPRLRLGSSRLRPSAIPHLCPRDQVRHPPHQVPWLRPKTDRIPRDRHRPDVS